MSTIKARRARVAVLAGVAAVVAAVAVPVAAIAGSGAAGPTVAAPITVPGATVGTSTSSATSAAATPSADPSTSDSTPADGGGRSTPEAGPSSAAPGTVQAGPTAAGSPTAVTTGQTAAQLPDQPAATSAAPPAAPSLPANGDAPAAGAVRLISPMDTGAAGDGVTDDSVALQAAFDLAGPGDVVMLPAGRVFAHSQVLRLRDAGMTLTGGGTLLATREASSSLTVAAPDVTVSGITLTISGTTRRWDAYEQQRLRLDGATRAVVRDVVIDGSAAAGVYVGGGTSGFVLDRVTVKNTRADGIHITQGSHDGQVVAPVVRNVGDDGVAVVSYRQDGVVCARIAVTSPSVDGSTGGRGLSVVGGTDVDFTGIDVRNTYGAAVYVAAEGGWNTAGVARVRVSGGTIVNANAATSIDHGSVLVYNGTADQLVSDVALTGLDVSGYRASMSRVLGLIVNSASSPGIRNATLNGITITGDRGPAALVSNQSSTTFTVSSVLRNGAALVRTGGYFR